MGPRGRGPGTCFERTLADTRLHGGPRTSEFGARGRLRRARAAPGLRAGGGSRGAERHGRLAAEIRVGMLCPWYFQAELSIKGLYLGFTEFVRQTIRGLLV